MSMTMSSYLWQIKYGESLNGTICIGVFPLQILGHVSPLLCGSMHLWLDGDRGSLRGWRRDVALQTDSFVVVVAAAAAAGRPLDVYINMNINDISSISEMRMVSKLCCTHPHSYCNFCALYQTTAAKYSAIVYELFSSGQTTCCRP